ncbi:MAG TPA: GNAT family N-acetyltransferase [Myxococcota bacterium]|jgi:L-amino acid N-acyltransferase YncA|nr:GNAT family N-acetyltransferase [Myxococcota bacterium]
MEIRSAQPADLPGITAIYNDVLATSTAIYAHTPSTLEARREWVQSRQKSGYPVLVAADRGDVQGFASFGDFRSWPGYRYSVEHTVHVRADRRRHGIGSALVVALLEPARALGKHAMIGGIDADNAASIRMHERLGFEKVAHLPEVGRKFGRWLDLVLVQRLLDPRGAARDD